MRSNASLSLAQQLLSKSLAEPLSRNTSQKAYVAGAGTDVLDVGEFARDISAHSNPYQGQYNCHQLPTAYKIFEKFYARWLCWL